jgi:hypothetical protein
MSDEITQGTDQGKEPEPPREPPNGPPPSNKTQGGATYTFLTSWLEPIGSVVVTLITTVMGLALPLIGLAFLAVIIHGIYTQTLFQLLKETDVARGFITFLVALITVAIAIILVVYAVTFKTSASKEERENFQNFFTSAKEVLTALIGVLGTIIGFYFGSSIEATKKEPIPQVTEAIVSEANPKPGETIWLTSHVSGGKPPFKYDISFTPPKINAIKEKSSPRRLIQEPISIPNDIGAGTEFTFKINMKDNDGKSVTFDEEKFKKIKVKDIAKGN